MVHFFRKNSKKRIAIIDDISYIAIFTGIFMTLPQVLKIWIEKEAAGVSVITWVSYSVLGIFWVLYGIVHKEKPIIVGNVLGLLLNVSIVVGLVMIRYAI